MKQPWVSTGSDGSGGHPRKYGTFPRKLRRYVYDRPVLTVEQAVEASSARAARQLGFADRGVLAVGKAADVIAFDAKTIRDVATYERPTELATGVRWVLVNGKIAVAEGKPTGVLAGQVLRRTPARTAVAK
jgi:N-acyl-D-aspartate/D-glutamate deacylase